MIIFKPYSSIKDFLQRFTLLKIGTLHIRLHKIMDKDRTTLFHNHPFNYISIILKNGYTETYIEKGLTKSISHNFLSIIKRKNTFVAGHFFVDLIGNSVCDQTQIRREGNETLAAQVLVSDGVP